MKLTLIEPKFNQEVYVDSNVKFINVLLGPMNFSKQKDMLLLYLIISIISCGIGWFFIGLNAKKLIIRDMILSGYKPKKDEDREFVRVLFGREINFSDDLKLSRLNSLDGKKDSFK